MLIPEFITLNGQRIQIVQKPLAEIDSECNGGWAMWEQNKLIIANDIPPSRQALVFLHEILHFVNIYLDEETVTYLSEALYGAIVNNQLNFVHAYAEGKMIKPSSER